jgi:uncharacterized membrane protein YbhN (UPF0104 family)
VTLLSRLPSLVAVLLFVAAVWVLYRELRTYDLQDVIGYLRSLPGHRLLLALALAVVSYVAAMGNDVLALRYVGHPLSLKRTALASFIGYTFSGTIGYALVTGGAVRYRLYSSWGLGAGAISKVVLFCSLGFWVGFSSLGGLIFLLAPPVPSEEIPLKVSLSALGVLLLLLMVAYVVWGAYKKPNLRIRGVTFGPPSWRIALGHIGVGSADMAATASVLYVLLPAVPGLTFDVFLGVFLLAFVAGVISHVPSGLGVFETVIVLLLAPFLSAAVVVGALLAYRGVHYLLPLLLATVLLITNEVREQGGPPKE